MSEDKGLLIKTAEEEAESREIPPVAHEARTPLEAVKSQEEERREGPSVSVETEVIPQTEELYLPPAKEEETTPETEPEGKVKEPEKVSEGEVKLAQVTTKALARELVNRIVEHLKKA